MSEIVDLCQCGLRQFDPAVASCGVPACRHKSKAARKLLAVEPTEREETLTEALERIAQWAAAYPTDIFPKMDDGYAKRAHEVLTANGMTIDRISADAIRHALRGIGRIARGALND